MPTDFFSLDRSFHRALFTASAVFAAFFFVASAVGQPFKADLTVMVPMSDGTRLATDVYLPKEGGPRWPARLVRTPYGRTHYANEYGPPSRRGYCMVIQDMRGRFDSQGKDLAFLDCGWGRNRDGVDTLSWILQQPWCNGRIGMQGASAMGFTQQLVAAADPPGLLAQYISVSGPSLYHHAAYVCGAVSPALVITWLTDGGFDPDNTWVTCLHPFYDAHWAAVDATTRVARIDLPAVHFGGWYDVFQQGTIDGFVVRQAHGGPKARGAQKLIIGPWSHGGPTGRPLGEFTFPANSRKTPYACGAEEWFDFYLKDIDTGVRKVPAAQYYTMGAMGEEGAPGNRWQHSDTWPPPAKPTPFYLYADGQLLVQAAEQTGGKREYDYNPLDPVPTHGGPLMTLPAGPFDQCELEARPDVLSFTSEPLPEPLEVTGRLAARLFIVSDRVDTDFTVKLTDVYPDGRSMNVADGLARCRCRQGFDRLALLTPGEPTPIDVDLWSTSMAFNRGHRLRIEISSSNYPRFDVNPNTGFPAFPMGPVLTAHNQVLCDKAFPSHVLLPVVTSLTPF